MSKTVGQFTYDEAVGSLSGPAAYMNEQGNALLDAIEAGTDTVFNMTAHFSPDAITAILVRLQTDYAGWHGMRQFERAYLR